MWVPAQVMMLNTTITCHTPPIQAPASFNPSTPMMVVVAVVIPAVMVATLAVVSPAYRVGARAFESAACSVWHGKTSSVTKIQGDTTAAVVQCLVCTVQQLSRQLAGGCACRVQSSGIQSFPGTKLATS